ncbi:MAG: hypothetical protein ACR2OM_05395 [Aestuariivirgaceae bacterium]
MKILALTLEMMARMALFTAVLAMTVRYTAQSRQPARAKQPADQPQV